MAPSRNLTEKTENDEGKPYKRADNDGVAILLNLKLEGFMGVCGNGRENRLGGLFEGDWGYGRPDGAACVWEHFIFL